MLNQPMSIIVEIPITLINNLQAHLNYSTDYYIADSLIDGNFNYGMRKPSLIGMMNYWRDNYLPRYKEREKYMNQFSHFRLVVQG